MTKYILLIKKTGSNKFIGGIPAKPKASLSQLKKLIQTKKRPGFNIKIVSVQQFKMLRSKIRRRKVKRRIKKKRK